MKPLPNAVASTLAAGTVVCCSLPLGSVKRRSTHLTSVVLDHF